MWVSGGGRTVARYLSRSSSVKNRRWGLLAPSNTIAVFIVHRANKPWSVATRSNATSLISGLMIGLQAVSSTLIHLLLQFVQTQPILIAPFEPGQMIGLSAPPSHSAILLGMLRGTPTASFNHTGHASSLEFAGFSQNRQRRFV